MRTSKTFLPFLVIACAGGLALVGCGDSKGMTTDTASAGPTSTTVGSASNTTTTNPTTSTTSTTTATSVGPTSTDSETGTDSDCNFVCTPDAGGGIKMCDIWNPDDCPEGEKCMPYDDAGGGFWNATKCSPIDANPGVAGDDCTVEGGATSGVDSCGKGLLCWFVDEEGQGTCIDMCTGSMENPMCPPNQECDISNDGVLILCLQNCDPVLVDCPMGQICFPTSTDSGKFICDFDASGEGGAQGDTCEFINVCDPGLFCADASLVPGCVDAIGCCTQFCDLGDPVCPMDTECTPFHEMNQAPPGLEHVGVCIIPP